MNAFVKNNIKILPLAALLVFSFVIEAKNPAKQEKKVDAKCFVELVGGGEKVTFWNISSKKVSSLSKSIIGHKVGVQGSRQKVKIYKTHECVLSKDNFTSSRAKIVDAKTAR